MSNAIESGTNQGEKTIRRIVKYPISVFLILFLNNPVFMSHFPVDIIPIFAYSEVGRRASSCQCGWHLKSDVMQAWGLSVGGQRKNPKVMQGVKT